MRRVGLALTAGLFLTASIGLTQDGPYKILKTAKVGGDGGFDYVNSDAANRKLYVARRSTPPHIDVYNLDSLEHLGQIADTGAHGAVISDKSHHGFASSKPIAMFDAKTLAPIKTIPVDGNPDGLLYDSFNDRVWVLSHSAPNVTVIDAKDGSVVGTIDLGGAPEQGATDGKGKVYIDIEDKDNIAVVDARTMKVTANYDLKGKGGTCAGLALDVKNEILFASCRNPQNMVILNAKDGNILESLPIGRGTDGAVFNPKTMEAFSSNGDGTLTIVKEESPAKFAVEENLKTMTGAKTLTLDPKTGHILLIAAEYGPPPAAPATPPPADKGGRGRGGRAPMLPDSFSIIVVGK
jgi:DNA-binding beta-propeller fold protein YncE